jgi:hypothetical protein
LIRKILMEKSTVCFVQDGLCTFVRRVENRFRGLVGGVVVLRVRKAS